MINQVSGRRLVENEVYFRQYNEGVLRNLDDLIELAKQHGQEEHIEDSDTPLHFYCECSNENCRDRVVIRPSEYNKIHKNRDRFVIACGHEVREIERVIDKRPGYWVVEKHIMPPESVKALHST